MDVSIKPDEKTHVHGSGISHIEQIIEQIIKPFRLKPAPGEVINAVSFSGKKDQINSVPTVFFIVGGFLLNESSE